MSDEFMRDAHSGREVSPFVGLVPTRLQREAAGSSRSVGREHGALTRNLRSTMPIVLAGSLALSTLGIGATVEAASPRPVRGPKPETSDLTKAVRDAVAGIAARATPAPAAALTTPPSELTIEAVAVPAHYTVRHGDTVSEIAGRYHLATATVLALNGLGWKSIIFPGQVLKLTKAAAVKPRAAKPSISKPAAATPHVTTASPSNATSAVKYTIKPGDTVSSIAKKHSVTVAAVLAANKLTASSIIYSGRTLIIPASAPATKPAASTPPATTPPASPPASSPSNATSAVSYTIKSGDSITAIAKKYSVTVAALLAANKLSASSIIYSGRKLIIPALAPVTSPAEVGAVTVPLSPEMKTNALTIIAVGRKLGVPSSGIIVALAAAAQESGLRNLTGGDKDSVGLFQQRPSTGWGTPAQLNNTTYAAELFFGGPRNPNKGTTRGLLDIPGWKSMTLTQAAQAVQISAFPNAYAKWQVSATAWLAELG